MHHLSLSALIDYIHLLDYREEAFYIVLRPEKLKKPIAAAVKTA